MAADLAVRDRAIRDWEVIQTDAGAALSPADLRAVAVGTWLPAAAPGTAASALRAVGAWDDEREAAGANPLPHRLLLHSGIRSFQPGWIRSGFLITSWFASKIFFHWFALP